MMKNKTIRIGIQAYGVYGRDRKVKSHFKNVIDVPIEIYSLPKERKGGFRYTERECIELGLAYFQQVQKALEGFKSYFKLNLTFLIVEAIGEGVERYSPMDIVRLESTKINIPDTKEKVVKKPAIKKSK